jgi:hypothetical protein
MGRMATVKIGKLKNIDPTSSTYGNIFISDLTGFEPSTINNDRYHLVSNIVEVEFEEVSTDISEEQENINQEINRLSDQIERLEREKKRL